MKSLRNKLWLSFGSLVSILLVVSALSIVMFSRYSHSLERVYRENYYSAVYCNTMKDSLDQLNTRAQKLIWQESAARKIDFAEPEMRFESALRLQLGNAFLPGELEASRHLEDVWHQFKQEYNSFNNGKGSLSDLYGKDLQSKYEELNHDAQNIAAMNMTNMVSIDGQTRQTLQTIRRTLLILVLGGIILAGVVIWTVSVTILGPVNELTESAKKIETGNLDLDLNLPKRSKDEVGRLIEAFNSMASRLREFRRIDHDRLLRVQETTQLAIDSLPDAVFVIGPDDTVEISNDAARSHFGIEPGLSITSLGLKWLVEMYEGVMSRFSRNWRTGPSAFCITVPDGELSHVQGTTPFYRGPEAGHFA